MASTALATTWPPRSATSRVALADWLACCAFSAFFFTVAEISSIEAEVCSRLAACSSVRCDRSVVLVEISAEALVTSRADALISAMVAPIRSAILLALSLSCPKCSLIVGGDALRQVAVGERAEHLIRSSSALATFSHSALIAVARLSMKPFLPSSRYALGEIAGDRGLDEIVDFALDRLLDGLVAPFHDGAGALAVLVHDRREDQMEFLAADRDVAFVASR